VKRACLIHRGEASRVTVDVAESAFERMRGLLGRPRLDVDEALWLEPCNAVHTFGMRFQVDVVFIDGSGRVMSIRRNVGRARMLTCWRSRTTLEMRAHAAQGWRISIGDTLAWRALP
jgi:uncharacterized membrane protein (UPF0127 family)